MPTPYSAMAAVAAGLAGIDPKSERAVEVFYTQTLPRYGADKRELIMDWLSATVAEPSAEEIDSLIRVVNPESVRRTESLGPSTRVFAGTREENTYASGGSRRVLRGVVVSDRGGKTIVVKVERRFTHPVMKKIVRRTKNYHAHDESNVAQLGQTVLIEEMKSHSKTWKLVEDRDEAATSTSSARS